MVLGFDVSVSGQLIWRFKFGGQVGVINGPHDDSLLLFFDGFNIVGVALGHVDHLGGTPCLIFLLSVKECVKRLKNLVSFTDVLPV